MNKNKTTRAFKLLCVFLCTVMLFCAALPPQASAASSASNYENAVLFWVNVERSRHGLSKVKTTDALCSASGVRAKELYSSFSHTRPNGSKWTTALSAEGVNYKSAAENIASGYTSPCSVVKAWMESSGHRSNMLNSKYSYLGVGLYYTESGKKYYWDQLFTGGVSYSGAYGTYNVAPKGLSVDKSSVKLSVGGTTTVTGTPSPVYATSEVTCTSSNSNVVKVTGTEVNVITVKGVSDGTAKLTVKCGSYSKTISVTVGTGTGGGSGSSTPSDPTPEDKPGSAFSDFIERILSFFCSVVPHDIFI